MLTKVAKLAAKSTEEDDIEFVPIKIKQFVIDSNQREFLMLDEIAKLFELKMGINLNKKIETAAEMNYNINNIEQELEQENAYIQQILKRINEKGIESVSLGEMIRYKKIINKRLNVFNQLQDEMNLGGGGLPNHKNGPPLSKELRDAFNNLTAKRGSLGIYVPSPLKDLRDGKISPDDPNVQLDPLNLLNEKGGNPIVETIIKSIKNIHMLNRGEDAQNLTEAQKMDIEAAIKRVEMLAKGELPLSELIAHASSRTNTAQSKREELLDDPNYRLSTPNDGTKRGNTISDLNTIHTGRDQIESYLDLDKRITDPTSIFELNLASVEQALLSSHPDLTLDSLTKLALQKLQSLQDIGGKSAEDRGSDRKKAIKGDGVITEETEEDERDGGKKTKKKKNPNIGVGASMHGYSLNHKTKGFKRTDNDDEKRALVENQKNLEKESILKRKELLETLLKQKLDKEEPEKKVEEEKVVKRERKSHPKKTRKIIKGTINDLDDQDTGSSIESADKVLVGGSSSESLADTNPIRSKDEPITTTITTTELLNVQTPPEKEKQEKEISPWTLVKQPSNIKSESPAKQSRGNEILIEDSKSDLISPLRKESDTIAIESPTTDKVEVKNRNVEPKPKRSTITKRLSYKAGEKRTDGNGQSSKNKTSTKKRNSEVLPRRNSAKLEVTTPSVSSVKKEVLEPELKEQLEVENKEKLQVKGQGHEDLPKHEKKPSIFKRQITIESKTNSSVNSRILDLKNLEESEGNQSKSDISAATTPLERKKPGLKIKTNHTVTNSPRNSDGPSPGRLSKSSKDDNNIDTPTTIVKTGDKRHSLFSELARESSVVESEANTPKSINNRKERSNSLARKVSDLKDETLSNIDLGTHIIHLI